MKVNCEFFTLVQNGGEWSSLLLEYITPGKKPHYPLNAKLGETQRWSGHFREEQNLLPLPGVKPWFLIHPAC